MNNKIMACLYLNLLPCLNLNKLLALLQVYQAPERLFAEETLAELSENNSFGKRFSEQVRRVQSKFNAEKEFEKVSQMGSQIILFDDPHYPELLKQIPDPPILLYVTGNTEVLSFFSLGVVGSRRASLNALQYAREFSRDLSLEGIQVISGCARGIDSSAHLGALDAKATTVGVLGTGLDVVYPRENGSLQKSIIEKGAIITELPLGSEPLRHHFPIRNRIIAGLSQGLLLVEASPRSGSLITAQMSMDYGRDIFCLPGRISHFGSKGNNDLIKQGAYLVDQAKDISGFYKDCLKKSNQQCLSSEAESLRSKFQGKRITAEEMLGFLGEDKNISDLMRLLSELEIAKYIKNNGYCYQF